LLVAPTHVALDEVLRRLDDLRISGGEENVVAARVVPRDGGRVDARLARYAPERLGEEAVADARSRLQELVNQVSASPAVNELEAARRRLDELRPLHQAAVTCTRLSGEVQETEVLVHQTGERQRRAEERARELEAQHRAADKAAHAAQPEGFLAKVGEFFSRNHSALVQTAEALAAKLEKQQEAGALLILEVQSAQQQLSQAREQLTAAQGELAVERRRLDREGRDNPADPEARFEELRDDERRLLLLIGPKERRRAAAGRWRAFLDDPQGHKRVCGWRLAGVNLVAATTQGIGASPDFRAQRFDLCIVDECSRVTRGELLTPASRANRIVLVGDEHQLPPFVETAEEQLLQAMALLDRCESPDAETLSAAAARLADEWSLDEPELRPLRVQQVAARALELSRRETPPRLKTVDERQGGEDRRVGFRTIANTLTMSCFDHALCQIDPERVARLSVQRRMPAAIAELVNQPVYGGAYRTPAHGVPGPIVTPGFAHAWMMVDTSARAKVNRTFREEQQGTGFINRGEADLVVRVLRQFFEASSASGEPLRSAMVISFYLGQSRLIKALLQKDLPAALRVSAILPVDRCQGQEAELVIVSFVRTHPHPSRGFGLWLQDPRRLNVAFTRARGTSSWWVA
jgi:hypothetical protein